MMKKIFCALAAAIFCGVFPINARAAVPRPEYPRPQFERPDWVNLNGTWSYAFDFGKSGLERKFNESKGFEGNILVPFCPESKLSGVQYKDFIEMMWYHRKLSVPAAWSGKNILLNFGGVDYFATIYIDGKVAGRHWGGTSSFAVDLTRFVEAGKEYDLVVQVADERRSMVQPSGKQSKSYASEGPSYTRTTGIWSTVWMEAVDRNGLQSVYIVPDVDGGRFVVRPTFYGVGAGQKLRATVMDGGKVVSTVTVPASEADLAILPLKNPKTWSPGSPFLYDMEFLVLDGADKVVDRVRSYAGLRKIHIEGDRVFLNNKPLYQRLVLDQGFYPDGLWTAPTDADLKRDIELSLAAGFNGARLHQKVFDERFHYWADRLGYLTWAESASWGMEQGDVEASRNFLGEWQQIVLRDRNHPSIITWTIFNEVWRPVGEKFLQYERTVRELYALTHALDYRPVNGVSGWAHVVTDLWTVHEYEQGPKKMDEILNRNPKGPVHLDPRNDASLYTGQPYLLDEWGGVKWVDKVWDGKSWGYGSTVRDVEEFYKRLDGLMDAIVATPYVRGHCYTQLTDIEQEQNGIYNYDRSPKFDMARIKAIFSKEPPK